MERKRKCSVPPDIIGSSLYDNKLNSFVTSTLNHKNTWKVNNFNRKYAEVTSSFATPNKVDQTQLQQLKKSKKKKTKIIKITMKMTIKQ